jgi:hypothetical protein
MKKEIVSQVIMSQMMKLGSSTDATKDNIPSVSLNQIQMWIIPQKAEHDDKYDINRGYFELLVHQTLEELIANGYIISSYRDQADYGDGQIYSLTEKGRQYLKEEIIITDNKDY